MAKSTATNYCGDRLSDLRTMSWYTAGALNNLTGGLWEKYPFNGKGTNDKGFPLTKTTDFKLNDGSAQRTLFDRTAQGDAYNKALDNAEASGDIFMAKRQADMLSSMLQGVGHRYTSRVRSLAATLSRRTSIAVMDADVMTQDINRVGG